MGTIPGLYSGANTSELSFLNQLMGTQQQPYQTGMPVSSLLYQLPRNAQNDALAALGMAPNPSDLYQQALQLYGIDQQKRNQGLSWYESLGALLPYLTGLGK